MKKLVTLVLLLCSVSIMAQTYDLKVSTLNNAATDEGEAQIAINPTDSSKMVIGFMQSSTTTISFKVYTSSNGGNTWQASPFNAASPTNTDYPGHIVAGGGDILLAYDKTGKLYCSWIYLLANPALPNYLDSLVWVSYWASSDNNGQTFTLQPGADHFWGRGKFSYSPQEVYNYADGICDRDWLAVDLTNGPNANKLYVGYINYPSNVNSTGLKVKSKAASANTFSSAVMAYPGNGQLTNLMVDGAGVLHYTFADVATNRIYHVSSSDGGQTFSSPHLISTAISTFPQSGKFLNDRENAAPSLAIDGANNLYIVWNDFPGNTFPKGYYSKSSNGGLTWSTPFDLSVRYGGNVFMPTVTAKNNRVTISANVVDNTKKSQYYILTSADNGATFSAPVLVSSGITDFAAIGKTVFVGDYSTSVRTNCNVFSTWTDARANGRKQYISKVNDCNSLGVQELTPVDATFSIEKLYPVPATDKMTVQINSSLDDEFAVVVMDIQGRTLINRSQPVTIGNTDISIDVSSLAAGNYLLKLTNRDNIFVTRLISVN